MANKLSNLLGNTTKNTSNVDAISDKIAQSVVKILLSSNKIDALNLKEKKDLSGGRKIGNIDTARYTTISENQNVRMRKGDGVANVLSRLYGLLKGSHDEDVKQMELTRNFKEEKLKEGRKYSKVTHQTFGKKRRRSRTKTGLAGLAVLGLISSMGSIMDWMENFTAEGGGLDKMLESITESWQSFKTEAYNYVNNIYQGMFPGHELFDDFEELKTNIKKTIDADIEFGNQVIKDFKLGVDGLIDATKNGLDVIKKEAIQVSGVVLESMTAKVKSMQKVMYDTAAFFLNMGPLDFFKLDKWKELLSIVPKAMGGFFTDKEKALGKNLRWHLLEGIAAQIKSVSDDASWLLNAEKEGAYQLGADLKFAAKKEIEGRDKFAAHVNQALSWLIAKEKEGAGQFGAHVKQGFTAVTDQASENWDYRLAQKFDPNPMNIPGRLADTALGISSSLNESTPSLSALIDPVKHSLGGPSTINSAKYNQKMDKPAVVTNNTITSPGGKPPGGPGVNATCRNDNKTISKINMGCVVGP